MRTLKEIIKDWKDVGNCRVAKDVDSIAVGYFRGVETLLYEIIIFPEDIDIDISEELDTPLIVSLSKRELDLIAETQQFLLTQTKNETERKWLSWQNKCIVTTVVNKQRII